MAQVAIVNETVFPTFNNVAATGEDGKRWSEPRVTEWIRDMTGDIDFVTAGITVPATSVSLNIDVALGVAYLKGYRVNIPAATTVTAAPSTTTYVFLRLLKDVNSFITSAVFETQASIIPPVDAMLLFSLVAGVGTITSTSALYQKNIRINDANEALIFAAN